MIIRNRDPYFAGSVALCAIGAIVLGTVGVSHFLTTSTSCASRVSFNADPVLFVKTAPVVLPEAMPAFAKIAIRAR